jgi:hypothetical protein
MSQTRLNRWFVTTATTVTSPGGKRGKLNLDEAIPCILMSEEGAKKYRKTGPD